MTRRLLSILALLGVLALGCSPSEPAADSPEPAANSPELAADSPELAANSGALIVYTVSEPLRSFAERIGGADVQVFFPAPPEVADPASWSPDADTVGAYGAADLVLLNGGGYARWLGRASLRSDRLVDTSASFRDRWIPLEDSASHAHGPEGAHSHVGVATTFWLDLELAKAQAHAIADAFAKARPDSEAGFRERLTVLDGELEGLDSRLERVVTELRDRTVLFSHPVYHYLARRYGLRGTAFHWEPQEPVPEADWVRVRKSGATLMLWEGEPLPATASRLQGLGVAVVVFEPAGGASEAGDFIDRMAANVDRLEAAAP